MPPGNENCLNSFFSPASSWLMFGIDLAVGAFEIGVAHQRRAAVAGTGDVEHIQVILLDDPVQMHIDEVLARRRAPVADHQRLHMRQLQRLAQQRIVVEIDLADRQIVGGAPVGVDQAQFVGFCGRMPVGGRTAGRRTLQHRGGRAHSRDPHLFRLSVRHTPPQGSSEANGTTPRGDRPDGSCCPAAPAGSETTQAAPRSGRGCR